MIIFAVVDFIRGDIYAGFPRGLMHLLQNKAYITMLGCIITGAYLIVGVFINMVRYIEIHFFERAFVASSITGETRAIGKVQRRYCLIERCR
jgi:hypothetical protein